MHGGHKANSMFGHCSYSYIIFNYLRQGYSHAVVYVRINGSSLIFVSLCVQTNFYEVVIGPAGIKQGNGLLWVH